MSAFSDAKLAGQYRLSAIINGIAGLCLISLGGVFLDAWLYFGLRFHYLLQLADIFATGVGLFGSAAICLSVAASHFSKWRGMPVS